MKQTNTRIFIFFSSFNAAALAFYMATETVNLTKGVILISFAAFVLFAMGALRSKWESRFTSFFSNIQIAVFSSIVLCIAMQVIYWVAPGIFPLNIRNLMGADSLGAAKKRLVEYLPYSPYAKLKPDTLVRVPGDYGPDTDFVYEWLTDRRGFKNGQKVAALDQVQVVAVGDSFTEGFGVHTDHTWASLLTAAGYTTYSLGVQGYAPTQMAGVFRHYGMPLKPSWVIIGYLDGVYEREKNFIKNETAELPSAIGRLVKADREIKKQYRYLATALAMTAQQSVKVFMTARQTERLYGEDPRYMAENKLKADNSILIGNMQRYRQEFRNFIVPATKDDIAKTGEWESTIKAFSGIIADARKIGANTAVLMLYNRPYIYFERATGQKLPGNVPAFVERELLKEFCRKNSVPLIDTWKAFSEYSNRIEEKTPITEYPYLRYDGHPNHKGNALIKETLLDFFRTMKVQDNFFTEL